MHTHSTVLTFSITQHASTFYSIKFLLHTNGLLLLLLESNDFSCIINRSIGLHSSVPNMCITFIWCNNREQQQKRTCTIHTHTQTYRLCGSLNWHFTNIIAIGKHSHLTFNISLLIKIAEKIQFICRVLPVYEHEHWTYAMHHSLLTPIQINKQTKSRKFIIRSLVGLDRAVRVCSVYGRPNNTTRKFDYALHLYLYLPFHIKHVNLIKLIIKYRVKKQGAYMMACEMFILHNMHHLTTGTGI